MTTTAEETLKESFGTIGKKYGYDRVGAEFVAYRDFKVKWTRSYKWADFQVSDYLQDAPVEVIDGLADTLFSKISGLESKPYPDEMTDWITSKDFTRNKQPVYIKRSRNITRSPVGEYKDLRGSLDRLKSMGIVPDEANPFLTWTKESLPSNAAYCSTLMDTIVVSSIFDSDSISDYVLDFVVYHEYLTTREGWAKFGKGEEFDLYAEEKKFPKWMEAENCINRLCLKI